MMVFGDYIERWHHLKCWNKHIRLRFQFKPFKKLSGFLYQTTQDSYGKVVQKKVSLEMERLKGR